MMRVIENIWCVRRSVFAGRVFTLLYYFFIYFIYLFMCRVTRLYSAVCHHMPHIIYVAIFFVSLSSLTPSPLAHGCTPWCHTTSKATPSQCPWRTINKDTGTLVCILSPFLGLCLPRSPCVTAARKYWRSAYNLNTQT